jgi:hypothetical protein
LCWSHARRKFFELANARRGKNAPPISPIALEAVARIDAIFAVERDINCASAQKRLRVRREILAPLVAALELWLRAKREALASRRHRQGHRLHAEPLAGIRALPRRWAHLPQK